MSSGFGGSTFEDWLNFFFRSDWDDKIEGFTDGELDVKSFDDLTLFARSLEFLGTERDDIQVWSDGFLKLSYFVSLVVVIEVGGKSKNPITREMIHHPKI